MNKSASVKNDLNVSSGSMKRMPIVKLYAKYTSINRL